MKPNHWLRIFITLLSIILFVSILLNWFLFTRSKLYYIQLNQTRLDPLGLNFYPSDFELQDITTSDKARVVFFGDSRAANWPFPSDLPQFEFINRGIGAQTSTQIVQRFDQHVKALDPKIVIVQACINDLKMIPLFPEKKEAIIASCKGNIQEIIRKATNIDAIIILTTVFPIGKVPFERRFFWSPEVALAINEVNSYIYTLEGQNVIIFDAYSILADDGVTQDEYVQDLLHLNSVGYEVLNRGLVDILSALE